VAIKGRRDLERTENRHVMPLFAGLKQCSESKLNDADRVENRLRRFDPAWKDVLA